MNTADRLRRCTRVAVALLLGPGATAAWCQSAAPEARIPGAGDLSEVGKIGRMHDSIRRTRSRESLYADIAGGYADYTNYLFAQSATQTYLNEGLGAYVQFNASPRVQFAAGLQATNNTSGVTIATHDLGDHCGTWFGYVQWQPQFRGLGSA